KGSSKGISSRTLLLLLAAGPVRALDQLAICAVLDPYTRCRWQALACLCESGGARGFLCGWVRLGDSNGAGRNLSPRPHSSALAAAGKDITTLGKDRLAQLDAARGETESGD